MRAVVAPLAALALFAPRLALAGLGPAHVMVVYNADAVGAKEVADQYVKARALPAGHVCALSGLDPKVTSIDLTTWDSKVRKPLDACLAAAPEPDEIDALVTVRGLPYLVKLSTGVIGFEALLQVGHGTKDGVEFSTLTQGPSASVPNPLFVKGGLSSEFTISNPYQDWYKSSAKVVSQKVAPPAFTRLGVVDKGASIKVQKQLYVVARLDGFDFVDAAALITRAIDAEKSTPPKGTLLCMHGADDARGARDPECEHATRMLKAAGFDATWLPTFDGKLTGKTVSAYFTGADSLRDAIAGNTYAPGAVVDNLTSFGAVPQNFFCSADGKTCPASESQTSIARFVRAGASFVHGTVAEPNNNVFPNAGALLHYTMGYSAGEAFLFHQQFLAWYNLHLGDPLLTPWAKRPEVTLGEARAGTLFAVKATHPDGVAKVRLYVAGKRVAEADGDTLTTTLPGAVGARVDVLAVGIAKSATAKRTGWLEPSVEVHADVQGWTAATLTIGAPLPVDPDGGPVADGGDAGNEGTPTTTDESGCGCRHASTSSTPRTYAGLAALGLLMLTRRRART